MYHDILVPIDLNAESSWAKSLPVAAKLAETFGARLHLLNVVPDFGAAIVATYFPADFEKQVLEEAEAKIESFAEAHLAGPVSAQLHIAHGRIYHEIKAAAERLDCDLIVMASHRPEIVDYLIGPNAEWVVRHSNRSVLVVRNGREDAAE